MPPAYAASFFIPPSIADDCSRDVTQEINDWLASVPDGTGELPSHLVFGEEGCYRVDGSVGTPYGADNPSGLRRRHLVLEGNGATIDGSFYEPPAYTNRAGLSFMYGTGIRVQNFTIRGSHPGPCGFASASDQTDACTAHPDFGEGAGFDDDYEWQHGIAFFAVDHAMALNNRIHNVRGDGVTVAQGGLYEYGSHILIDGNSINGTGRMAVGVTSGHDVTIANNTFDRISYHAIDLEPEAGNPVKDVTISSNTIRRHYLAFISASTGNCGPNEARENYVVANNLMQKGGITTAPAMAFTQESYCTSDNRGLTITGNTLRKTDGSAGSYDGDANRTPYHNATIFVGDWRDMRINDNRIIQTGYTDTGAMWLRDLSGIKEVKRNDAREVMHVYNYGGSWDGSTVGTYDGPEVTACGNTAAGGKQHPCPTPD